MLKHLKAEHGIVCARPGERFGYFGWPSVARMEDGTLVAAASGLRSEHVCPWGKSVLFFSHDGGESWSEPRIVNDTPMDDRDCGIVSLGGRKLLLSWFTYDVRPVLAEKGWFYEQLSKDDIAGWLEALAPLDDGTVCKWSGSWLRTSPDGGASWSDFIRAPVSSPHGPTTLKDGGLLYLGKLRDMPQKDWDDGRIAASRSDDLGRTWSELGAIPLPAGMDMRNLHEPHMVELASGRLLGMVRYHNPKGRDSFGMLQSGSEDGGRTWTEARLLDVIGYPPHLLQHSSGVLICAYGCRVKPFGQRVMFSHDDGRTWDADWILRDDGPSQDLGYPCSVELPDGSLLTVYYQQPSGEKDKCALLCSRWRLP